MQLKLPAHWVMAGLVFDESIIRKASEVSDLCVNTSIAATGKIKYILWCHN